MTIYYPCTFDNEAMMDKMAQFNIGDLVIHKRMRYRAIVVDVDPVFQASGVYNPQAVSRQFATRNPWYRLLVDESSQMTYVEECLLIADPNIYPINNPKITHYLKQYEGGYYSSNIKH
jgi:heat shock protein HspQ